MNKYEFETTVDAVQAAGRWKPPSDGSEHNDYIFDRMTLAGGNEDEDREISFGMTIPRDAFDPSPRLDQKVKITVELLNGKKRTV